MKRRIYLGLSLLVIILLLTSFVATGCGTKEPSTTPSTAPTSPSTAVPPPAAEVLKLKFSCNFQPFEPPGVNGMFFCDTLEKLSNGKIEIERFTGGQLGTEPEQLGLLRSGSVDIATFIITTYFAELPLHTLTPYQITNKEDVVNKFYSLLFTIPETAPFFQAEQTKQNIKILNMHCIGESGILSSEVAVTWEQLKGKKIGMFILDKGYEALGLQHVTVQVPEMYEALSRGVVDCIGLPPGPMMVLKMYESAKSYVSIGTYTAAIPIIVNLDMWNKLTPEIQNWFMEAAQASQKNSIQVDNDMVNAAYNTFKDAGMVVTILPQNEIEQYFKLKYKFDVDETWMNDCAKAGVGDQAKIVKKYWDELTWGKSQ